MNLYLTKIIELILALGVRNLPINRYVTTIFVVFLVTYYQTKMFYLSMMVSLITLLGYTIYNYSLNTEYTENRLLNNSLLIVYLIVLMLSIPNIKNINKNYINYINFTLIAYVFISSFEYFAHRIIMHCDEKNKIYRGISYLIPYLKQTCKSHKEHHLEVKPDMKIHEVKDEDTLIFRWKLFAMLFPVIFISLLLANKISNSNIHLLTIIIFSFIFLFIIFYMWNKVHPRFHDYDVKQLNIKVGPHDNGYFDTSYFEKLLFKNHEAHHIQKGEKKGNYNIIVLGADEWFGRNVKVIDNIEYCKTHQEEEICK